MLSLFPELLDWSWYTPLLFRGFLVAYLLTFVFTLLRKHHTGERKIADIGFGLLLSLLALMLLFGVYTQLAGAIGFSLATIALFFQKRYKKELKESGWFYALVALVSLSFVFLGAGPYAFDIPL